MRNLFYVLVDLGACIFAGAAGEYSELKVGLSLTSNEGMLHSNHAFLRRSTETSSVRLSISNLKYIGEREKTLKGPL